MEKQHPIFNLIIKIKTQNLCSIDIPKVERIFVLKRKVEKQHPIFNLIIEIEIQIFTPKIGRIFV